MPKNKTFRQHFYKIIPSSIYEGTNKIVIISFSMDMEKHFLKIFGGNDAKKIVTRSLSPNLYSWK
jgi:hypothetical protein